MHDSTYSKVDTAKNPYFRLSNPIEYPIQFNQNDTVDQIQRNQRLCFDL